MKNINDTARDNIRNQIAEIERHCDSELVCLITKSSARYMLFPLLIAALVALVMPVVQALPVWPDIETTFTHQTMLFFALAAVFVFTPLRNRLTPKQIRIQNCERFASEQFFRHQLHDTKARNGVLIFVSWDEKFVTVIGDKGINAKVGQRDWDMLISDFIGQVKTGEIEKGFMQITRGAGDLLMEHFPVTTAKTDELPNHLIETDRPIYIS